MLEDRKTLILKLQKALHGARDGKSLPLVQLDSASSAPASSLSGPTVSVPVVSDDNSSDGLVAETDSE
jgi:hypothetical protein